MDARPTNSSDLLLQSILDSQRDMSRKLEETVSKMATKDDMERLFEQMSLYVPRLELQATFQAITQRLDMNDRAIKVEADKINGLLASRLPKWFWPAVSGGLAIFLPVITLLMQYVLRLPTPHGP
jgi:hypothetical protein